MPNRRCGKLLFLACLFLISSVLIVNSSASPSIDPTDGYSSLHEKKYSMTFSLTVTNGGPGDVNNLKVWISIISNWTSTFSPYLPNLQYSNITSISPEPNETLIDSNAGNVIAFYNFSSLAAGRSIAVQMSYSIQLIESRWLINEASVGTYNLSDPVYQKYTQPDINIESDDSLIISKANEIVGSETNPYSKSKLIYEWVANNLAYTVQGNERGALWALTNQQGDCSEFSDLFIALCRASGVPARKIIGWAFDQLLYASQGSSESFTDFPGHAWVEVLIPGYGWVPADPTWANAGFNYWAYMDTVHVVCIRGQNVTVPNKPEPLIEFSSLYYQYEYSGGSPSVTDSYTFDITVVELNSFLIILDLQIMAITIGIVAMISIAIAVLSKPKKIVENSWHGTSNFGDYCGIV
ncbi:MAG: transglutaminase family protein [Promethearchaeota archaeon]